MSVLVWSEKAAGEQGGHAGRDTGRLDSSSEITHGREIGTWSEGRYTSVGECRRVPEGRPTREEQPDGRWFRLS